MAKKRKDAASEALVVGGPSAIVPHRDDRRLTVVAWSDDQRKIIRDQYAPGSTDTEFAALMAVAEAKRLNPLTGQLHFVKRRVQNRETNQYEDRWATQTGIDGFRALADRTGLYDGQDEPEFEYEIEKFKQADGVEREIKHLVFARVKVYRKGINRPFVGIAYFDEYVQRKRDGSPTQMWAEKPHIMLSKVGEALALRKAFPDDLGGLHIGEEFNEQGPSHAEQLSGGGAARQYIEATATPAVVDLDKYIAMIKACSSIPALEELGERLNRERFTTVERRQIGECYLARRKELQHVLDEEARRALREEEKPQDGVTP